MLLSILLNSNLDGSLAGKAEEAAQAAGNAAKAAGGAAQTAGGQPATMGPIVIILYILLLCALFYFFLVRPNQKREKEREAMRSQIAVGDWVVTNSGLYGKVVSIYANEFLIEFGTNKSVNIPVVKSEIAGRKEPGNSPAQEVEEVADKPKKKKKHGLF